MFKCVNVGNLDVKDAEFKLRNTQWILVKKQNKNKTEFNF